MDYETTADGTDHATACGTQGRRYLSIENGDSVRLVAVEREVMHIGRGLAVDVRLDDMTVSRRHAILLSGPDAVKLIDDRSSNGTHVNGRRVVEATLCDGDILTLGNVVLRYVEREAPGAGRGHRRAPAVRDGARAPAAG